MTQEEAKRALEVMAAYVKGEKIQFRLRDSKKENGKTLLRKAQILIGVIMITEFNQNLGELKKRKAIFI